MTLHIGQYRHVHRTLHWDVLRTSYFNVLRTSVGDVPWRHIEDHMATSIRRLSGTCFWRVGTTFLENAGCYQNRNPSHIFCEAYLYLISKSFKKLSLMQSLFLLKHRAILHRTLLNTITDVFMRIFWNTYTENFGKYPEKSIQCSSNTRLKLPYFSGSAQFFRLVLSGNSLNESILLKQQDYYQDSTSL